MLNSLAEDSLRKVENSICVSVDIKRTSTQKPLFFTLLRSNCDGGMWFSKSEGRVIKEEYLVMKPKGQGREISKIISSEFVCIEFRGFLSAFEYPCNQNL